MGRGFLVRRAALEEKHLAPRFGGFFETLLAAVKSRQFARGFKGAGSLGNCRPKLHCRQCGNALRFELTRSLDGHA